MPLDSTPVFDAISRVTDASGNPVSGGTLEFYVAGTSTPKTVYADADLTVALGTTVATNSGGYPVTGGNVQTLVYVGTAAYKLVVKDAGGATIITHDNVKGAPEIPAGDTSALPSTPVSVKTSAYSIVVGDRGKLFAAVTTAGSVVLTLPSAVTAGDGFRVGVQHAAGANAAVIGTVSSQTITRATRVASSSLSLVDIGETVWLVSDGANWRVDSYAPGVMTTPLPYFVVADRLTAPPSSPTAGARYIVTGTPTGVWATLGVVVNEVLEADGGGGWIRYTPEVGWLAAVGDESGLFTRWNGTSWVDLTNITAPAASTLKTATYSYTLAQGTNGAVVAAAAWTAVPLNTEDSDSIGASVASNQVTLPIGSYIVNAVASAHLAVQFRLRLRNVTTGSIVYGPIVTASAAGDGVTATLVAPITIAAATEALVLEYYATAPGGAAVLGTAQNLSGIAERYATLDVLSLTAQQGPQGATGPQGGRGLDAGFPYAWSTATSGDPGSGKVRGNNATLSSVTEVGISVTDNAASSVGVWVASLDDSTSVTKGLLKFTKDGLPGTTVTYRITGTGTNNGTWWSFPVAFVSIGSGAISNGDTGTVVPMTQGDKGETGFAGPTGTAGAGYGGASTSNNSIGTGSKTWTVTPAGLAYTTASRVRLSSSAGTMDGAVTAYNPGTGVLTALIDQTTGSGSSTSWAVSLVGSPGTGTATPGGASPQMQMNSGGVIAGTTGLEYDVGNQRRQIVRGAGMYEEIPSAYTSTAAVSHRWGYTTSALTNGPPSEVNYVNPVAWHGWNVSAPGVLIDTAKPGSWTSHEYRFYQSATFLHEYHLVHLAPGTGLSINTTTSGGKLTGVSVASGGSNYQVGTRIPVPGGVNGVVEVTTVGGGGVVTGLTVYDAGDSGYTAASGLSAPHSEMRWLSAVMPNNQGAESGIVNRADRWELQTANGRQLFQMSASNPLAITLGVFSSLQFSFEVNNAPAARQRNAAGSSFVTLPFVDNFDRISFGAGFLANAAAADTEYNAVGIINVTTLAANKALLHGQQTNATTGNVYAFNFYNMQATGKVIGAVGNATSSGDAILEARVEAGGNDPMLSLLINGGQGYSLGVDNSDGDKFKISAGTQRLGNGTEDRVVIDGNTVAVVNRPFKLPTYTVATLPAASSTYEGARAYVTDASAAAPAFMSSPTGGGANKVPVFCTGAAWVYG